MSSPPEQRWNPRKYAANASYVAELGKPVLDLLAPAPGERVLDLGCGDGTLAREIARLGGDVIGIDASEAMVEAARSSGVRAYCMDGASLQFSGEFDAVFSNASLHWIKSAEAVIAGVWRALRPGGRFVAELGGRGNVATILDAIETALARRGRTMTSPWFFPEPQQYACLLENVGFVVDTLELFPRPTQLPGDVRGWLETFAQHFFNAMSESEREGVLTEIVEDLRGKLADAEGNWFADYVRLRFSATKPRAAG